MSAPRGNNPDHPWVQPIVVAKTGHHQDTIRCAAQASVAVYFEPSTDAYPRTNFGSWLDGPFTKTVRRATMSQMSALALWAADNRVPYADAECHDSAAIAFAPMRYEDMPRQIARFQVRGTDFAWRDIPRHRFGTPQDPADWEPAAPVRVWVNDALTTGKAAAAAAHALWAWMLPHQIESTPLLDRWLAAGLPFRLGFEREDSLRELIGPPNTHPIVDAGLTEVARSTMTAAYEPDDLAYWRRLPAAPPFVV